MLSRRAHDLQPHLRRRLVHLLVVNVETLQGVVKGVRTAPFHSALSCHLDALCVYWYMHAWSAFWYGDLGGAAVSIV